MALQDQAGLSVLIAESHRTVAQALTRLISAFGNASVTATTTTVQGTIKAGRKLEPDVAIIDLELSPDGSLVHALHRASPSTRIVVLAERSSDDADVLMKSLAAGAVAAIYKESSMEELSMALKGASRETPVVPGEAARVLLDSYVQSLEDKRRRDLALIETLATAVEIRDSGTGQHLHRVAALAQQCLQKVDAGLAKNRDIQFGFMLHDVGKIGIPDAILNKPGPLSDKEWDVMRRHPELGVDVVKPAALSSAAIDVILYHHEHWDGTGYPARLAGEEIPVAARAFAVADAYDAMTTDRPYRGAMTKGDAAQIILAHAGSTYDPDVVDAFLSIAPDPPASEPELDEDRDVDVVINLRERRGETTVA